MGETTAEGTIACPACGRLTLEAEGADEVCAVCGWEDDAQARKDPHYAGGDNGISLKEARANVDRFGVAFPPSEVGGS